MNGHGKRSSRLNRLLYARVPFVDPFHEPIPGTGHPLGIIAQSWLLINCLLFSSAALAALFLGVVHLAWRWIAGRPAPEDAQVCAIIGGIVFGFFIGAGCFMAIARRVGRHGVEFLLLTMTLVPVIGPALAIIFFAVQAVEWLFKRRAKRQEID